MTRAIRFARVWLALALAACAGASVLAQTTRAGESSTAGANTEINRPFHDPDVTVWTERLEGESREIYRRRAEIVAASGVSKAMTVADVGAGTGLFTMLFAREVGPSGRVIAVDISPSFLKSIAQRAKESGFSNVATVLGTQTDTRLPENAVDVVFTSDTYHHFENVVPVLSSIRKALKAGGRFIVIDFERIPGVSPPRTLEHVRAGKPAVIAEVESNGFTLRDEISSVELKQNYYLIFEKR